MPVTLHPIIPRFHHFRMIFAEAGLRTDPLAFDGRIKGVLLLWDINTQLIATAARVAVYVSRYALKMFWKFHPT